MAETLNIRARYPDGQTLTLQGLAATTTFKTLVNHLRTHCGWQSEPRILMAGPPPRELKEPPLKPIRQVIPTGTALIVEPHPDDLPPLASAVGASGRGRGRGGRGRGARGGRGRGRGGQAGYGQTSGMSMIGDPYFDDEPVPVSPLGPRGRVRGRGGRVRVARGGRGRGRGGQAGQGQASVTNNISTLADLSKRPRSSANKRRLDSDDDDKNDATWHISAIVSDDEDTGAPGSSSGGGTKRRRNANVNNASHRSGSGAGSSSLPPFSAASWAAAESTDMSAIAVEAGLGATQGQLGAMLASSVFDVEGRTDNQISRELRANFGNALKKRYAEADGERRYSAYLGRSFEMTPLMNGLKFRVRYRPMEGRNWIEENNGEAFMSWPRPLIQAVVKQVLTNKEERLRLRPLEMAAVSPRMFWNLIRIFYVHQSQQQGGNSNGTSAALSIEEGLKSLVPDADWSFLDRRQRELSEKAKRNAQNKADMGWESD